MSTGIYTRTKEHNKKNSEARKGVPWSANRVKAVKKKEKKAKAKVTGNKPVWKPKKGIPSRFPKGTSGNPNGRPKGTKNKFSIAELVEAIKQVEKSKRRKFMVEWITCSWGNPAAMDNIMQYMFPKLKSIEGVLATFESSMDDDLAKSIQDKLRGRYG